MEKMKAPAKNKPCPCGSGLKYKRCCLLELEDDRRLDELDDLDDVDRPRGGFADSLALLAEPLLEHSDGSLEQVQKAMSVAAVAWNIGLLPRDQQLAAIDETIAESSMETRDKENFVLLLTGLVARFNELYPHGFGRPE
jgi:hypothetical protein